MCACSQEVERICDDTSSISTSRDRAMCTHVTRDVESSLRSVRAYPRVRACVISRAHACTRMRATRGGGYDSHARASAWISRAHERARASRSRAMRTRCAQRTIARVASDTRVTCTRVPSSRVRRERRSATVAGTRRSPARLREPGFRVGSPEQIRTAVTALRGRRPRPLDDGARPLGRGTRAASSGGRTRTPNDRTRTCCVADYTTPEGPARLADRVSRRAVSPVLESRRSRAARSRASGRVPAEQVHRVEQRQARGAALDRGVERGHRLADLSKPERVDAPAGGRAPRASTRTSRRARSPRRAPRRSVRSLDDRPTTRAAIGKSASSTNRNSIWSTICTSVTARSCRERRPPRDDRRRRRDRRSGARRERLDPRDELVERQAADPLAVQPVELLPVEAGRRVRHPVEVERRDELVGVEHLAPSSAGAHPRSAR